MPQRWFIRNTSTDPLTGRQPLLCGHQMPVGHVTEMTGHVPEFGGHDAETVGHALPKYAVGLIEAEPAAAGADAELAAIEAGAQDFEAPAEGVATFLTDPADLDLVSRALPAQGFTVMSAKLGYKPKNPIDASSLSAEQLDEVESFLAALDANEDVQNVFAGLQA